MRKWMSAIFLLVLTLHGSAVHAGPVWLGVMGDSLSDPYSKYTAPGMWGSAGDRNWVEQLRNLRSASILIDDQAKAGATSTDLITQGQHTTLAQDLHHVGKGFAALVIGANDISAYLGSVQNGGSLDSTPFVKNLLSNVKTAVDTVQSVGGKVVLGNIPNLTQTPALQFLLASHSGLAALVANAVQTANAELDKFAAQRHLPIVDLYRLGSLANNPLMLGGTQGTSFYAPDGFHPGTVLQGLLADAMLDALHARYGLDVHGLRLSDQDILRQAHLSANDGTTYFDTGRFVSVHNTPEPGTLTLCGVAVVIGFVGHYRTRRAGVVALRS